MVESTGRRLQRAAADTAEAIQAYLSESPSLIGTRIRCEANEERIVLRGYVSTYSMKHTARVLAESVSGDRQIEDRLDVIPVPPKWDQDENWNRADS